MHTAKNHNGFTLIELLVVVVIIGILASIGIASYNSSINNAHYGKVISDFEEISLAAKRYYLKYGIYPYDRPPEALTVYWDPPSGFLLPDRLEKWPTPPCTGWKYDWDNWIRDAAHNIANAQAANGNPEQMVRVTLKNSTGDSQFYYCIFDANSNVTTPCREAADTAVDIKTSTLKSISCN